MGDPSVVKKMADLLRAGAAMLGERCPLCGLPLFRLRSGEVVCPIHGRVYIVRDEAEYTRVTVQGVLEQLERYVAGKIADLLKGIDSRNVGGGVDELKGWLDVLERVERILAIVEARARKASGSRK